MVISRNRRIAASIALGAAMIGPRVAANAAVTQAPPTWLTMQGSVVHLSLIAGYNSANAGFNFDGAAHGQMTVTVPLGAKVVATYKNGAQGAFHDAVIIPYTMPLPAQASKPAFAGASSPLPRFAPGAPVASGAQTFSFTASRAGTYMIVCGIAGHALAGMWDTFVVSPTAKTATSTFGAAAATTTPPASLPAGAASLISTSGKVVHLSLIADYNSANAGFNFDGGAHGQMIVTVPLGATVDAVFKNNSATPHDVVIIPNQSTVPSHTVATAFKGSASPRPQFRPGGSGQKPGTPVPFSFVASKAGTYMIICGVPGHAIAGMWDTFVVSPTATTASITFKQ